MVVALNYGASSDPVWAAAGGAHRRCVGGGVRRCHASKLHLHSRTLLLISLVGLLGVAATLLFAEAMTLGDLSIVAVLGWLGPAVTIFWARLFLHERLRPLQLAAVVAVLTGVVLMTVG